MSRRLLCYGLTSIGVCLGVLGPWPAAASQASTVPDTSECDAEKFRIAVSGGGGQTVDYPMYVGVGMGIFEEEGVEIEFTQAEGSGNIITATVSGDTDASIVTLPGVIQAVDSGAPIRAIASLQVGATLALPVTAEFAERVGIVDGEDFTLDRFGDLRGIRVGVTQVGGGGDLFARSVLEAGGLEVDSDFEIVSLGDQPSMTAAFGRGIIDAMSASPGGAIATIQEFGGSYLFDPLSQVLADLSADLAPLDRQQGAVLLVNEASLDDADDRAVLGCVARGIGRALDEIHADPVAAGIAAREFLPQFDGQDATYENLTVGLATLTPDSPELLEELVAGSIGYLNDTAPSPVEVGFDDVVDNSIADSVAVAAVSRVVAVAARDDRS